MCILCLRSRRQANHQSYAQSTIREMLGWYGLQDGVGAEAASAAAEPATRPNPHLLLDVSTEQPHTEATPSGSDGNQAGCGTEEQRHAVNGWDSHAPTAVEQKNLEGMVSSPNSPVDGRRGVGNRKLIGMRYLFQPLGDNQSLLEKAKIWVARHDNKYFVGWTKEQLKKVDPILQPNVPITSDMYKLHMNRSEYCRNVKLKYCLECDTEWAQQFRDKLATPMAKGGFSGLCQAKIAAAELWRKYSENYKSHQARYPNPKSKYRIQSYSSENMLSPEGVDEDEEEVELHGDEEEEDGLEKSWAAMQQEMGICEEEEKRSEANLSPEVTTSKMDKDEGDDSGKSQGHDIVKSPNGKAMVLQPKPAASSEESGCKDVGPVSGDSVGEEYEGGQSPSKASEAVTTTTSSMPVTTQYVPMFASLQQNLQQMPKVMHMMSPISPYPGPSQDTKQKPLIFRPAEYKKSERGLSYLFPSLADQQLSLLDKVKITVMRHKSNYFLGWNEEELLKVDPMVRPKMQVTKDLYKEYCHRNAMKYDSNLQYAMESPEGWAVDFRERLSKPPSEGGFHSLCEVKQEAGRLWKEYSGKYKMHNVVKAQMDLNNEKTAYIRKGMRGKGRNMEKVIPPGVMMEGSRNQFSSRLRSASSSPGMEELHSPSSLAASPNSAVSHSSAPARSSRSADSSPLSMQQRQAQFSPGSIPALSQPREATHFPVTPSSSPYSTATDFSVNAEESRKRRRADEGYVCSSNGSSPRVLEETSEQPWKQPRLVSQDGDEHSESQQTSSWRTPGLTFNLPGVAHAPFGVPQRNFPDQGSAEDAGADGIDSVDTLFLPLPSQLSVAQQLAIWLERHANNYFLSVPKEQLLNLDPLLRPHIQVTEENYRRFISDNMVGMFDRVGKIMNSVASWAKAYQEKIHKKCQEGGFLNVEEALTEAVDLWKQHAEYEDPPCNVCEAAVCCTVPSMVDSVNMQPSPAHHESGRQIPALIPFKIEPQTRPAFVHSASDLSQALDLSVSTPGGATDSSCCSKTSERCSSTKDSLQQIVWQCRERLHNFCREDPSSSWHERLRPYMGVLKEKLGDKYTCPQRVSECMVDLLLAVVHEELTYSN